MTKKRKETSNEKERFEQQLAELRARFGPENISIMGKHSFPELTLIWEEKEYEPHEEEFEPIREENDE